MEEVNIPEHNKGKLTKIKANGFVVLVEHDNHMIMRGLQG